MLKTKNQSYVNNGGGEQDRTDDLLLARQALSQLSYTPNLWWAWEDLNFRPHAYQACALKPPELQAHDYLQGKIPCK